MFKNILSHFYVDILAVLANYIIFKNLNRVIKYYMYHTCSNMSIAVCIKTYFHLI